MTKCGLCLMLYTEIYNQHEIHGKNIKRKFLKKIEGLSVKNHENIRRNYRKIFVFWVAFFSILINTHDVKFIVLLSWIHFSVKYRHTAPTSRTIFILQN